MWIVVIQFWYSYNDSYICPNIFITDPTFLVVKILYLQHIWHTVPNILDSTKCQYMLITWQMFGGFQIDSGWRLSPLPEEPNMITELELSAYPLTLGREERLKVQLITNEQWFSQSSLCERATRPSPNSKTQEALRLNTGRAAYLEKAHWLHTSVPEHCPVYLSSSFSFSVLYDKWVQQA